jgi:tripeptide aminopeptidase
MVADFADMVGVDSPSFGERAMAELMKAKLGGEGFDVEEDGAAARLPGDCGNLIATLRGDPALPAVGLLAHMDTVEPCRGKKCVADPEDADILRSDGTTILGGDDAAGMVAALEVARRLKEGGVRHGDIQIILTVAEELGLQGAKNLDYSKVRAEYFFVFDSGTAPGSVVARAPTHANMTFTVTGRAAHAGIEPEKGLSAVKVFAEAVAGMRLGRIDAETTANIGTVRGGTVVNAVCEKVVAEGEARSYSDESLRAQMAHMRQRFEEACAKCGAGFDCEETIKYRGYALGAGDAIVRLLQEAEGRRMAAAGAVWAPSRAGAAAGGAATEAAAETVAEIAAEAATGGTVGKAPGEAKPLLARAHAAAQASPAPHAAQASPSAAASPLAMVDTGGGSDANILIEKGFAAATLPMGMHDVHSTGEYANLRETDRAVELVLKVFELLAERGPA